MLGCVVRREITGGDSFRASILNSDNLVTTYEENAEPLTLRHKALWQLTNCSGFPVR